MFSVIAQNSLLIYVIVDCFMSVSSLPNSTTLDQCSTWNTSTVGIIFPGVNGTITNGTITNGTITNGPIINSSLQLSLSKSGLDINRNTDEIALLDDQNQRILVFNRTNTTSFFAILSDASNLTNISGISSLSAVAFHQNNSIYFTDNWTRQLMKLTTPLDYGVNTTLLSDLAFLNGSTSVPFNASGLCVDSTDERIYISDRDHHQIILYNQNALNGIIYAGNGIICAGNGTAGNATNQLNSPTSIVISSNRTLFVNDAGNNRIQMFTYNSPNGTTVPGNVTNCLGLSLYSPDLLIINTKTAVHLFNLTANHIRCAIGCNDASLNDTHNALIDNDGNFLLTNDNLLLNYSHFEQCSNYTTVTTSTISTTSTGSANFSPVDSCTNGTFGRNCSFSMSICNISNPCVNGGGCAEIPGNTPGYNCSCSWGYNGTNCENDFRPCKPDTCWHGGTCWNTSMTVFGCLCVSGYNGTHCELTDDLCANATCQNRGVCFSQFLNYTCQCLSGFGGRHCETTDKSTVVRAIVSKSFGYIAILMLAMVIGFIVVMDVLKYGFGIDPVQFERDALRKKLHKASPKKIKEPPVIHRFQYVN